MEMETLHTVDQAETAEPGPSNQRVSYRDAQVWKDIKAETGFASYEDYLKYYMDDRPDFRSKLSIMETEREQQWTQIVIYDLSTEERHPSQPRLRCFCYSGTELIQALRKPPDGVCVQLVLWLRTDPPLNPEMVDTLGLGLRLDPDDFKHRKRWSPPPRKSGPRIKSIFVEQTVAAISQGFMRDGANEVPVVLIASTRRSSFLDLLGSRFVADHCETPPFGKSPRVSIPLEGKRGGYRPLEGIGTDYARAVQNFTAQDRAVQPTKQSLLLAALSPLLYVEVCRITDRINRVQATYTDVVFGVSDESGGPRVPAKGLDEHRTELRRTTEVSEDILGQFSRYPDFEGHSDLFKQPSYVSIVTNLRSLIADARRLDAEVRDFKQIQVGDLALKESQKSIELSNAQIREAKSVKIFTVLAFFYVPLNLATSIFGMNIEQLNGSGQQIWVFFTTAVVALLITGGSWLCSNHLATHTAMLWYKERAAAKRDLNEKRKSREYGLLLRIAMLVWLVRNGHTLWIWKSGAGAAILTNNNAVGNQKFWGTVIKQAGSACHYVSRYSAPSQTLYKHAFSTHPDDMACWTTTFGDFLPRWVPWPRNAEDISTEASA